MAILVALLYWLEHSVLFVIIAIASIFLHELGHILPALARGVRFSVEFTLLGAQVSYNQDDYYPQGAFWATMVSLGGPLVNLVLLAIGLPLFLNGAEWTQQVGLYLFVLNLYLLAFNILPTIFLDGGKAGYLILMGTMPLSAKIALSLYFTLVIYASLVIFSTASWITMVIALFLAAIILGTAFTTPSDRFSSMAKRETITAFGFYAVLSLSNLILFFLGISIPTF